LAGAEEGVKKFTWPPINADERGLRNKNVYRRASAFIGGPK
jgi:hypothetical protein